MTAPAISTPRVYAHRQELVRLETEVTPELAERVRAVAGRERGALKAFINEAIDRELVRRERLVDRRRSTRST